MTITICRCGNIVRDDEHPQPCRISLAGRPRPRRGTLPCPRRAAEAPHPSTPPRRREERDGADGGSEDDAAERQQTLAPAAGGGTRRTPTDRQYGLVLHRRPVRLRPLRPRLHVDLPARLRARPTPRGPRQTAMTPLELTA